MPTGAENNNNENSDDYVRGVLIPMHSFGLGVLLIMLSAFGFGLMPIFATYAYAGGVNVPTLLFLRFSLAAICLFAYLCWRRTVWRLGRRELLSLLFLGAVLYTLQSTFYFSAVRYIPASLAALILYLYQVFVAGLAVWLEKEHLSLHTVLPAILSLTGIAVVLGAPLGDVDGFGVLLAFGAAIVYSVYITLGRRVVAAVSPLMTSAIISAFAALSFLLFGLVDNSLQFAFSGLTWAVIAGVVVFSTILAMATFFAGMERIGATRASILSTVEPVVTIGCSALLLGERLSCLQGFGAILVLAGAVWVVWQRQQPA